MKFLPEHQTTSKSVVIWLRCGLTRNRTRHERVDIDSGPDNTGLGEITNVEGGKVAADEGDLDSSTQTICHTLKQCQWDFFFSKSYVDFHHHYHHLTPS